MKQKQDRRKYIVMLVACIGLICGAGLIYGYLRLSGERKKNPVPDKPVVSFQGEGMHLEKVESEGVVEAPAIPPVKIRDYAWRRNPFIPTEKPLSAGRSPNNNRQPVSTVSFELQGVVRSDGGFVAIINGETCREGSMLQGWRVEKIGDYRVFLRRGGRKKILELSENPGGIGVR